MSDTQKILGDEAKIETKIETRVEKLENINEKLDSQIASYVDFWNQKIQIAQEKIKQEKEQHKNSILEMYGEHIVYTLQMFLFDQYNLGSKDVPSVLSGKVVIRKDCIFCIPCYLSNDMHDCAALGITDISSGKVLRDNVGKEFLLEGKHFVKFISPLPVRDLETIIKPLVENYFTKCKMDFKITLQRNGFYICSYHLPFY